MGHQQCGCGREFNGEIAVADGIQGIFRCFIEAQ